MEEKKAGSRNETGKGLVVLTSLEYGGVQEFKVEEFKKRASRLREEERNGPRFAACGTQAKTESVEHPATDLPGTLIQGRPFRLQTPLSVLSGGSGGQATKRGNLSSRHCSFHFGQAA